MAQPHNLIFGLHAAQTLLQTQPERALKICVQKERQDQKLQQLIRLAKTQQISIETLPKKTLDQISEHANHQGIIIYCQKARSYHEGDLKTLLAEPRLVLVLDNIQDPHNLGACFRTAEAAGVQAIIAPKDKSVGITPTVSKVACGAVELVPFIQVTNLARALEQLKELGFWLYGTAGEATQTVYQTKFTGATAIIMGAEGEGMRRLTREHCDGLIKIPMAGQLTSLNVSVATGIVLFEVVRQCGSG